VIGALVSRGEEVASLVPLQRRATVSLDMQSPTTTALDLARRDRERTERFQARASPPNAWMKRAGKRRPRPPRLR
jgi:antitoxin (DNA-binding transcriptional repressor) of toxin-antitoxin stability system